MFVERELLKENVGIQDQIHASYGSLNRYEFTGEQFTIHPVRMQADTRDLLNSSLYLAHTGIQRYASKIVEEQIARTKENKIDKELSHLYELTISGQAAFELHDPESALREVAVLLNEAWQVKRELSKSISSPAIDEIYDGAISAGALGGKLCGAGGGGFVLLIVPPHARGRVQEKLGDRKLIPIRIDEVGSVILRS
jgi:D-glycero-alpha-D-manno-heptose-7-phosphate kinase